MIVMAMVVMHNSSAMLALRESDKNSNKISKNLRKLLSGMKINAAGDDASGYAISERMRVRIRALDKAYENTKTGFNMIDTASKAVQEQLELMKGIKEKVINAHNDTNTDMDRLTLQKEIDHSFEQIQNIAYETTYNGKHLLSGGDHVKESAFAWEVTDEAVKVEGSDDLNVIPDNYDVLDEQEGAFDVFSLYKTNTSTDGGKTGLVTAAPWVVKTENLVNLQRAKFEATFNYDNVEDMDAKGVRVKCVNGNEASADFVFTRTTGRKYNTSGSVNEVNIASCTTVAEAVDKLASAINSAFSSYATVAASGNKITLISKCDTAQGNSNSIEGLNLVGGDVISGIDRTAATATGAVFGSFSGGSDASGIVGDLDNPYQPATPATATVTGLSSANAGSGFVIKLSRGQVYIRLNNGSDGPSYNESDKTWTIGKNASFTDQKLGNVLISMSGGTMTITTPTGARYNRSSFIDGISAATSTITTYTTVSGANMTKTSTVAVVSPSKYILDVSAYKGNTNSEDLEEFIQSLTGITNNYFHVTTDTQVGPWSCYCEFIDTGSRSAVAGVSKAGYDTIDLNNMRRAVLSGKDIATAFAETVINSGYMSRFATLYKDGDDVIGVAFENSYSKLADDIFVDRDATLGYYEIDFSTVDTSDISQLNEKGFRFYCATDDLQWYNFLFDDGSEERPKRAKSGTAALDINTATIDISKITDTASLVKAIYKDGDAMMADMNHYYRLSLKADDDSKLIVYDNRRYDISVPRYYGDKYNERGAKIADGVLDNVVKSYRNVMQKKIVIQDTDKASQHTCFYINQTTLDQLFEYKVGSDDIFKYRISDARTREKFLGNDETGEKGMLDTAINHLIDAQTLLGAQAARLEATGENLTVATENEQISESVIRDANMAKEQVEYAKVHILMQAAQSMLAQANQNSGEVLRLLQ